MKFSFEVKEEQEKIDMRYSCNCGNIEEFNSTYAQYKLGRKKFNPNGNIATFAQWRSWYEKKVVIR